MNLLAINSSQNTDSSVTRNLVGDFVSAWSDRFGAEAITHQDIGQTPPPHIDLTFIQASKSQDDRLSDEQQQSLVLSDAYIAELRAADAVVIGAPMHNFSISSPLRTWIDHVVRAGQTFSYSENGPQGLLAGKKVYAVTARGGDYSEGGPIHALDHQEPYLRFILGFIGLDDVTFIHTQGLAMGDDVHELAVANAKKEISDQVSALPLPVETVAA